MIDRDLVDRYRRALVAADRDAAVQVALDALAVEPDPDAVILSLIVWSQADAGAQWQRGRWGVADEHVATAINEAVLDAVGFAVRDVGRRDHGTVVVACPGAEWHSMPARIFAQRVRLRGWEVVFVGAATPSAHLGPILQKFDVVATAISASLPLNLRSAAELAVASHAAGVPVLVGGRAFAGSPLRAAAVGADASADDVEPGVVVLERWRDAPPAMPFPEPATSDEADRLAAGEDALVEGAMAALLHELPVIARFSQEKLDHTRRDLRYIVQFLGVALWSGDPTIFGDFLSWLTQVLQARGLPPSLVPISLRAIRGVAAPDHPRAVALLDEATAG